MPKQAAEKKQQNQKVSVPDSAFKFEPQTMTHKHDAQFDALEEELSDK